MTNNSRVIFSYQHDIVHHCNSEVTELYTDASCFAATDKVTKDISERRWDTVRQTCFVDELVFRFGIIWSEGLKRGYDFTDVSLSEKQKSEEHNIHTASRIRKYLVLRRHTIAAPYCARLLHFIANGSRSFFVLINQIQRQPPFVNTIGANFELSARFVRFYLRFQLCRFLVL